MLPFKDNVKNQMVQRIKEKNTCAQNMIFTTSEKQTEKKS